MKSRVLAALAVGACVSPLQAQVIENFEHGNEALWTLVNTPVDTMNIVAAAAHDGALGAEFVTGGNPSFRLRTDVPTAPGNTYYAYVRARGGLNTIGRVYMGVGASAGGAWSAVFAPNTSQILLQNNTGWAFPTVATAPMAFTADTWYVLALDWAANGDMTVRLLDETKTNTIAATTPAATGFTTPGGTALRGFSTNAAVMIDLDTITQDGGTPPCYPDCDGDDALTLADFGCFQTKFALGDLYADCNGDLVLNLADFGCFQTAFALGCP